MCWPKKMMQPCLVSLHLISLVQSRHSWVHEGHSLLARFADAADGTRDSMDSMHAGAVRPGGGSVQQRKQGKLTLVESWGVVR